MRFFRKRKLFAVAALHIVFFVLIFSFSNLIAPVFPQDVPPPGSKVGSEQESFRKPKRELEPENKYLIDYEIEDLPPGVISGASFFVKEIAVDGETNLESFEIQKILSPYKNRELKLADLKKAARTLTRAIRSKGYVTTRVLVPPQKVDQGVVHFKVMEGKLGKISIQGNKYFKERFMKRVLKARPGEILRYSRLERDLLRLNTHPDRDVRAVLIPGEEPETTDLVLNVKETFPIHVGYSFDNTGTRLTGRLRHGISLAHTNLLGLDDMLQAKFLITDGSHFAGVAVDYLLPITASADFIFDYTHVNTRLGGDDFNDLKILGKANIWSPTVVQRVIDRDHFDVSLFTGVDFKEIETTQGGLSNSRDNLRILRLGAQFAERDKGGRTFITDEFEFGFSRILGASDKIDSNSSRTEAGAQFFRTVIDFGRLQKLPLESFLILRGSTYLTPDKLPASEQMRVGGAATVRGYPEGDYLGEHGISGSTELRCPCYFIPRDWKYPKSENSVRDSIQLLGFFDVARVATKGAPQFQPGNRTLAGMGGGIRFNLTRKPLGRNVSARLDWGVPVGEAPLTEKKGSRLHFSLNMTF